jgi:hypothetical protein
LCELDYSLGRFSTQSLQGSRGLQPDHVPA